MKRFVSALAAISAAAIAGPWAIRAETTNLPPVSVDPPAAVRPAPKARPAQKTSKAPRNKGEPTTAPAPGTPSTSGTSLTVPNTEQATRTIERTPGAVAIVPDTAFRNTAATTVKDVLDFVPGVWAQPKWAEDSRLSIRGSGLSRNFHLRGIQLYMDGIPINTSDGYGDFQEIDPSAYRYVEVYRGANALRFGANSLGGAINFVMPSGRDARWFDGLFDVGSFGFVRGAASSGGVSGPFDYFVAGSAQRADGYRDHSDGHAERGSANFGYQISEQVETRFYVNANHVRQRIPGEVTKQSALTSPRTAWTDNVINDWQRNIDTVRIANKTAVRFDNAMLEFGAFAVERRLQHPIFQWLDYRYSDYGTFGRITHEGSIGGYRNRIVAGVNVLNGTIDADQYANVGGQKGALLSSRIQRPDNYSAYVENSFYVLPTVAVVTGTQYLYAVRDQQVNYTVQGDPNGRSTFSLWSPKVGVLWDVDPTWQVFGNISRSAEVPSFGESVAPNFLNPTLPNIPFFDIKAQTATTYEIGTRGRRPDYSWDVALYRAEIHNELQCLYSAFGNCNVTNADRTIHQGIELGLGATLAKSMIVAGPKPDRVWLNVAYTFNDFRFDNDPRFGDNRLPGAPPHYLRAELLYKHPSGVSFGPNIEWVPESYFVDSANTLKTDPYFLWGLRAVYDNERDVSAYIEGRNLGNTTYISSASIIDVANASSRLFSPGTGRAVFAGVRGKL